MHKLINAHNVNHINVGFRITKVGEDIEKQTVGQLIHTESQTHTHAHTH